MVVGVVVVVVVIQRLVFAIKVALADKIGADWIAWDRNALSSRALRDDRTLWVRGKAVLARPAVCRAATRVQALAAPVMV